jgi:hypothetical protein
MSTVKSEALKDGKPVERARWHLSWNRVAGIVAWLVGVFFTYRFFIAAEPGASPLVAAGAAALIQWVLTLVERPLWRRLASKPGAKLVPLAIVVTIIDGLLNGAGIYPFTGRIAQTGLGKMIADLFGVQPQLSTQSAIILAIVLGLILAGLPEALWQYDE